MKHSFLKLITAGLLIFSAGASQAIMLSFEPAVQSALPGQQVEVDIRISDLGDFASPSLGAFDLDVSFDDTILDFAGLTFGDPVLGNQLDVLGIGFNPAGVAEDPDPNVGLVDFFEISLDAPSDLDSLQAGSFILATLTFDAVSAGVSSLSFASVTLADALGNLLATTTTTGAIAVPEPAALSLMLLGLAGIGYRRQLDKKLN